MEEVMDMSYFMLWESISISIQRKTIIANLYLKRGTTGEELDSKQLTDNNKKQEDKRRYNK